MVEGCSISDSTPPSDSASVKSLTFAEQPEDLLLAAADAEGERAAVAAHLAPRQFVLRMRLEAGMVHGLDLGVPFQPARDRQRVAVVRFHAQGQRLDAAQHQEAVLRRFAGAQGVLQDSRCVRPARVESTTMPPPTTSEWPLMYLVVEWRTMSMPRSSGRWK